VLLDSALGRGKTPADPRPIRRNQAASAPRQQFGVWRQATGALVVRVGRGAPCEDPRLGASGLTRRPRLVLTVLSGPCVTNTSIPSQQTAYRASLCIEKFNEANACVCVSKCVSVSRVDATVVRVECTWTRTSLYIAAGSTLKLAASLPPSSIKFSIFFQLRTRLTDATLRG
jgi:hypothetical protein